MRRTTLTILETYFEDDGTPIDPGSPATWREHAHGTGPRPATLNNAQTAAEEGVRETIKILHQQCLNNMPHRQPGNATFDRSLEHAPTAAEAAGAAPLNASMHVIHTSLSLPNSGQHQASKLQAEGTIQALTQAVCAAISAYHDTVYAAARTAMLVRIQHPDRDQANDTFSSLAAAAAHTNETLAAAKADANSILSTLEPGTRRQKGPSKQI